MQLHNKPTNCSIYQWSLANPSPLSSVSIPVAYQLSLCQTDCGPHINQKINMIMFRTPPKAKISYSLGYQDLLLVILCTPCVLQWELFYLLIWQRHMQKDKNFGERNSSICCLSYLTWVNKWRCIWIQRRTFAFLRPYSLEMNVLNEVDIHYNSMLFIDFAKQPGFVFLTF